MIQADKDLLEAARGMNEFLTENTNTDLIETLCVLYPVFMAHSIEKICSTLLSISENMEVAKRTESK